MPNLVGIGNSQVPTNAMLGGLAYQDSVGNIDIEKIKAKTSDTAVDIFVYDTRKDSDGGAWRHRTQNTSWYNEGAGQYRGARKEFPTVAVIVAENDILTIYDGDDTNLPMWMVFEAGGANGANMIGRTSENNNCVSMLNGLMCVGRTSFGFHMINFIADRARFKEAGYDTPYVAPIGTNRNGGNAWLGANVDGQDIVNDLVKDVAMTVLPNAQIDAATGLPTPTIAVATAGGVSVIKDNGIVVDLTSSHSGYANCKFTGIADNQVLLSFENNDASRRFWVHDIPSSDTTVTSSVILRGSADEFYKDYNTGFSGNALNFHGYHSIPTPNYKYASKTLLTSNYLYLGLDKNLAIIHRNKNSAGGEDGMLCGIANNYNTGWMHGDNKGAFLSSTDDTNLSGTSLIANGDFSSNSTAAFTTVAGGTAAVVGGLLKLTDTGGVFCYASAPFTTVPGDQYFVTADIVNNSNTANANYIRCGNSHNGIEFHNTNYGTGYGTKTFYFTATATTTYLTLISGNGVGEIGHWDNVFAYRFDSDRSVHNEGLRPYGTITKTAVATGAELVAYSGFSGSNYLLQPYNSELNFTTTMSIMFWVNGWVGSDSLLHRGPGTTRNSKTSFHLYCSYDYNYRITFTTNGSTEQTFEFNHTANLSGWQCVCFTLSGGTVRGFRNGVEQTMSSTSFSGNIFSQATDENGLWIGTGPVGGAADTASLALLRLSASVPTADQVKKIYNDEKCLFHENAKCTLYGTSDAVTGLAFDDTTDVLHVGTSSGRSEFQGLTRINNTTTAVTTAISASNELVAEQ